MRKLIVLLVVALFAVQAQAGFTLTEDFESNVGVPAGSTEDADPDWQGVDFWEGLAGDQTQTQVIDDGAGNNYLNSKGGLPNWFWDEAPYGVGDLTNTIQNEDFTFQFDAKGDWRLFVGRNNNANNGVQWQAINLFTTSAGETQTAWHDGTKLSIGNGVFLDRTIWNTLKIVSHAGTWIGAIMVAAPTFDLYVNGSLAGAGMLWNWDTYDNPATIPLNNVQFSGVNGTNGMLDNIIIDVPEPATMALLALGLPLLRRKK